MFYKKLNYLKLYLFFYIFVHCLKDSTDAISLDFLDDTGKIYKLVYDVANLLPCSKTNNTNDISLTLYTRSNPNGEAVSINNNNIAKKRTFFIAHGWLNSKNSNSCQLIKNELLCKGDYNVFIIDWEPIAKNKDYACPVKNIDFVSKTVADMIYSMVLQNKLDLNETTLIGHSLGAHVVGIAGYKLQTTYRCPLQCKVNYIYGLDPALPGFDDKTIGSRISAEDAKYVEIIHTNAGKLGFDRHIGLADFYINGGINQPGCSKTKFADSCSHSRSYELFAESIKSEYNFCYTFYSNIYVMGGLKNKVSWPGDYYIDTNNEEPYVKKIDICKKEQSEVIYDCPSKYQITPYFF